VKISILAAGAGGMYCGSCLRDNALAVALRRAGHEVTLIPLYTPLRTVSPAANIPEVFYGGVNVYLQHASRIFRHTPRMLDAILDRPWLLGIAGRMGEKIDPAKVSSLTHDVLIGEDGNATKELSRLVRFLREEVRPQIVSLPNLMFIGLARTFRRVLNVPVICELTGEDIFLDAMSGADRATIQASIRARAADVTRFVSTTDSYARHMAAYLDIPRERIDVVYTGLAPELFANASAAAAKRPPTIGYLARACPEKGLGRLIDAFLILRKNPLMSQTRLRIAGYIGGRDRDWVTGLQQRVIDAGLNEFVDWLGEVDQAGKIAMLDSIDVFTVPTAYPEAKGIYLLEAMARGVPVVQPAHGSFPELIEQTQGGILVPPGDPRALAAALIDLLSDQQIRADLGKRGYDAVRERFTDDRMAQQMLEVCEAALKDEPAPARDDHALTVRDVYKEYPTPAEPLTVLRGVSFSLTAGQTLAIVGPSGSGKSTLLNILGTLDAPTRGEVLLDGENPFILGPKKLAALRARRIGFVFQDHHLLPQCTAIENVLVAKLAAGKVHKPDEDRAAELLRTVGLADRATHLPSELSGGERQRVAIARALMNSPRLLLCDEPTGNLDQHNSKSVTELLLKLARELGSILVTVTHSEAVAAMFERQMRMTDGVLESATS